MRTYFLLVLALCVATTLFGQNDFWTMANTNEFRTGIGLGSILAVVASWSRNQSLLWAILHAFMGWFYVVYYLITRAFVGR